MRLGDQTGWIILYIPFILAGWLPTCHTDLHQHQQCVHALHAFVHTAPSQKFSSQIHAGKIMLWSTGDDHKSFALSPIERWSLIPGPWTRTGLSDCLTNTMWEKWCPGTPELLCRKPCSFSLDLFERLLWLRSSFCIKTPTPPRDCHAREAGEWVVGDRSSPAQPAGIPRHQNVRNPWFL